MKTIVVIEFLILFFCLGLSMLADTNSKELEAAATAGDLGSMFELGSIALLEGDYSKAFEWLSKGAEAKHGPSEAGLGFMYFNGFACDKDVTKARDLYEKSAMSGAHQGLNNLAHLYRYGLGGLEKDLPKAVELLEDAARLGNENAANTLSKIYMGNELGAPNIEMILKWLKFGAERNYPGSLSDLGYSYQHGIGVDRNLQKAVELYLKGIDYGSVVAKTNLGYLYLKGDGVQQDYQKAMTLFTEAANENEIGGIINLAVMHFNGFGGNRDPAKAYTLLGKAVNLGSKQAEQLLKELKAKESEHKEYQ